MLSELCGKREKEKLRQSRLLREVLEGILYPYEQPMTEALQRISGSVIGPHLAQLLFRLVNHLFDTHATFPALIRTRCSCILCLSTRCPTTWT